MLDSFLDLLFKAEPQVADQAKQTVLRDYIALKGEVGADLSIPFFVSLARDMYPGTMFNTVAVELKDEEKARQEKQGGQISNYLSVAERTNSLLAYVRLDDDPLVNKLIKKHPRYIAPSNSSPNFTWADVIGTLFEPEDDLRKTWIGAVNVFCKKRIEEWRPTFGEIRQVSEQVLDLEKSVLSRATLSAYTEAVCDLYSLDIRRFQREHLRPAVERLTKAQGVACVVVVKGEKNHDYNSISINLPRRSVHLKWSETLPVCLFRPKPATCYD